MNETRRHTAKDLSVSGVTAFLLTAACILILSLPALGQDASTGIELRIVGVFDLHPPLPEEGDDVQIGVLVENYGTKDARDVAVYFYEDDVWFDKEVVDVRSGDTVYIQTYWTAAYGDRYLSAVIDPAGDLDEDAGDNRVGAWVTVR